MKKEPCLKGGKEKQKTQDEMWVFVASGSARQPHTSAFASLPFCKCFYSLKWLCEIYKIKLFREIRFLFGRVFVSAERSDADL